MKDLAGRAELKRLWEAAHRRLEQTGGLVGGARATVDAPSPDERRAVDRLLGTRTRGRALRVGLDRLDGVLREAVGASLAEVVVAACGPLRDRPAERAAADHAEQEMWAAAERHPATGRHPELASWFHRLRATGRLHRLDHPARRLREALDVLEHLPAPEPLGRAGLAAAVLGDSHALDDAQPAGRLVLSALASLVGQADSPTAAADRRRLWTGQGVLLDESSSTVLTLGLRPGPAGPLTEAATRWADAGVPLPVPLAAVSAEPWRLEAGDVVSVCENATVLEAAAARFGARCAPLVCVEGNPSLSGRGLLRSLAEGGARLRYHGDFGSGGIAIGNIVIGDLGADPWRFDSAAHAEAVAMVRSRGLPCRRLAGRVPIARWDAALSLAIEGAGFEVEEEQVLEVLLGDLATST